MEKIAVIHEADERVFEEKCNDALRSGYKISSTGCGFANSERYDFCGVWQAILVKDSN